MTNLLNQFWCVIPFFNFEDNKFFVPNLERQIKLLKSIGVPFVIIEAGYKGKFWLPDAPYVIKLSTNSILWQKERLINYGASLAPESTKYIMWLDSGVLINHNSIGVAVKYLAEYDILLAFNACIHLYEDGSIWRHLEAWPVGIATGGGHILRKDSFWATGGLYDYGITGSGDALYWNGITSFSWYESDDWANIYHYTEWQKKARSLSLKISCLPFPMLHLWHGPWKARQFMTRLEMLTKYNYDPVTDIIIHNHVLEFVGNKPELEEDVKQFFIRRGA